MTKDRDPGSPPSLDRRVFVKTAAAAAAGALVSFGEAESAGLTPVRVQYDWLINNAQIGDIVAQRKGYFAEEGLEVTFGPGGPNAQTVPPVLAGQSQLGQLSSTAQFFTAYGAGRPLMLFAAGFRYSPYAYISLPRNPIRTPSDLLGKTVAINPNGRYLLDLVMTANKLDRSQVKVVTMGTDVSALLSGQVDAVTAFVTNTKTLSVLGPDIVTLFPAKIGIPNYANAYFTAADAYQSQKQELIKFTRAVSKGWGWAYNNRREAVDIMCEKYPAFDRQIEYDTVDLIMTMSFDEDTKKFGWGWFSGEKLTKQVELFKAAGTIPENAPGVAESVTWEVLDATADARSKLG